MGEGTDREPRGVAERVVGRRGRSVYLGEEGCLPCGRGSYGTSVRRGGMGGSRGVWPAGVPQLPL